ncbi:MAG: serpin family protein [Tannerellaceae bacterium]|jgi:serpin B|nr:serpin family protein [Tannerellaceae bacterium]
MKNFKLYLCLAALAACQGGKEPAEDIRPVEPDPEVVQDIPYIRRVDIDLTEGEKLIAQQSRIFAFDLLQTVHRNEDSQKNIFISPLSLNLALLMLNNGAAGGTQKELENILGGGTVSNETLNTFAQKMVKAMQELDTRAVFESANSIWIRKDFPVLELFKETNRQYYEAEVRNEDFALPSTLGLINGWVEEKTHGKVPQILTGIDPSALMYLINTLYFKGLWEYPFAKEATVDKPFYNPDGSTPALPTMHAVRTDHVLQTELFSMMELPFGNRAFSMVILLPNEGVSLDAVLESLNAETWEQYLADLPKKTYTVNLQLPRFTIEYEKTLNDDLKALGLPAIFENSDFSRINADAGLFVSSVLQKTFAQVDETGMEGAAATLIGMVGANINEEVPPSLDFHVNRPFLFFIKEQSTGIPFFSGVVKHPD